MTLDGAKMAPLKLWDCEAVVGAHVDGVGFAGFLTGSQFHRVFSSKAPYAGAQRGSRLSPLWGDSG